MGITSCISGRRSWSERGYCGPIQPKKIGQANATAAKMVNQATLPIITPMRMPLAGPRRKGSSACSTDSIPSPIADQIDHVSTEEAVAMAIRLAREEGLFAGTSTGGNVVAALRLAEQLGPDATVVTLMCDSGMPQSSAVIHPSTSGPAGAPSRRRR